MKLSTAAQLALKGLDRKGKERLAESLGVSVSTVNRYIAENDDNLTKAAALQVIRGITGLPDQEILTGTDMLQS